MSSGNATQQQTSSRSLPRHFKLATKLTTHAQSYYDVAKDQLYACKCIGLLMSQPYLQVARVFLTRLYRCGARGEVEWGGEGELGLGRKVTRQGQTLQGCGVDGF